MFRLDATQCYAASALPSRSLPLAGEPQIPLYTADIEEDIRGLTGKQAEEFGGKLSYPSKMDTPAWAIPAKYCQTGSRMSKVEGSVCNDKVCYAKRGRVHLPAVQRVYEANYRKLFGEQWTPAMAALIRWHPDGRFRWMLSGDLQGVNHLKNIIQICDATRNVLHWLPTREGAMLKECRDLIPPNLTVRLSAPLVDGPVPSWWPITSQVVTDGEDLCPSSVYGGNCGEHDCTACWDAGVETVKYLKH